MGFSVCHTCRQNQNGIYKLSRSVERHLVSHLKFNGTVEIFNEVENEVVFSDYWGSIFVFASKYSNLYT